MKKRNWFWIFIILIIVILVGGVVIKHWNSLEALVDSFRYSQNEVVEKLDENKKQLQQYIDENENITVRDLTEEEANLLNSGEITEEEIVDILVGKTPKKEPPSETSPVVEQKEPETAENTSDMIVSQAIAKLYIQKSKYLAKLDDIEARVRQEYIDMVKSNKLSSEEKKAAKQRFLNSNLSTVASWEKECDSVVYGILDEIKATLKDSNQEDSIVKKLEQAYLNEKRLKKSYFINRYMD